MKPTSAVFLLLACFVVAPVVRLQAQNEDQAAKIEAYGGYYYVRFNVNSYRTGISSSATYNGNGGGVQLEYNANNWFGIVGDVAGYGATTTTNGALVGGAVSYLFGPRFNFRRGKITPFVHTLFGGIWTTAGIGYSESENNFATATGGGIDVKVSKRVSIRPVQAEYFMTKVPDGLNDRQSNLRLGAGIVVRVDKE